MRATRVLSAYVLLALVSNVSVQAKNKTSYSRGVLSEMQSVSCGYMQKSGSTVAGALITGAQHSKSRELLCQEYTLKTDRVTYRIRPKEEKHPALLPVGEEAEFRLKKDQMLLRIPESDNKEREYIVVSMAPTAEFANEIESTRRPPKPHGAALKVNKAGDSASDRPTSDVSESVPPRSDAIGAARSAVGSQSSPAVPVQGSAASAGTASTGALQVESAPAGAEIYVDSAIAGRTPALLTLKPGSHLLQVVMAGYKDWVTNVNVAAGVQQEVKVSLSH